MDDNKTCSKLLNLVKVLVEGSSNDCLLPLEAIEIGFSAKVVIRSLKSTQKSLERDFRKNVQKFVIKVVQKILERSPLKYKLTRSMASLSPIEMSSINHKILAAWFESLVTELHQSSWITSLEAERAERQYKELLENKDAMKEMKLFEMKDRVDTFLSKILGRESPDLTKVVRIILIMSHGNASVESGFSVNGDIILPNMLEETIVAQRIVYENVRKAGGPTHVIITPEMIKMVRNAHKQYDNDRKRKEASHSEGQKRLAAKRKASNDLTKAVAEKKRVLDDMKKKMMETISKYDGEISALQEEVFRK